MKKNVVERIKRTLETRGWRIEKIKKMDFWAFHEQAPAFCVVQAGQTLIFFCDLPLNASWKKKKANFYELLNSINNTLSHGMRVIKLNDDPVDMLHISTVWHNYYDRKEFDRFFNRFIVSVIDLYGSEELVKRLKDCGCR